MSLFNHSMALSVCLSSIIQWLYLYVFLQSFNGSVCMSFFNHSMAHLYVSLQSFNGSFCMSLFNNLISLSVCLFSIIQWLYLYFSLQSFNGSICMSLFNHSMALSVCLLHDDGTAICFQQYFG